MPPTMICQACNKKIKRWQRSTRDDRYGWLHASLTCYKLARLRDVNN